MKQFKSEKHVGSYAYDPDAPLHIAFDENVLPYLTCNVFQHSDGLLRQIDEIMLKDPLNTLKDTCEEFMKRYGANMSGLFIYGDATSKKQDTKLQKGQNFYLLIKGYLSKLKPIFRVPKANPSVVMSRNFTNDILAGSVEGLSLRFDAKCRNSINDYQHCTEDADGKVNKKVIRDKVTGQSYQEHGHACDTLRYILTSMFLDKYKKIYERLKLWRIITKSTRTIKDRLTILLMILKNGNMFGITLTHFQKLLSQGEDAKVDPARLQRVSKTKLRTRKIEDLTFSDFVDLERYFENNDYKNFCRIFVKRKFFYLPTSHAFSHGRLRKSEERIIRTVSVHL